MLRKRCTSRFWTPENGVGSWLSCTRPTGHSGSHRVAADRWTSAEAMSVGNQEAAPTTGAAATQGMDNGTHGTSPSK